MYIHNHKIIYIFLLIIISVSVLQIFNKSDSTKFTTHNPSDMFLSEGLPVAELLTPNKKTPSILEINNNSKSSEILNNIFNPTRNDNLNEYLINIFCIEKNNKYIKAASGSGIFLSNPNNEDGVIITNAHVARHLLDSNKKCSGRTGSPTKTTHSLVLKYIPSYWLNTNNQYIIGDPDQNSTGEYDFAIIETKKIITSKTKNDNLNIYKKLNQGLKIRISDYNENNVLNSIYIYSYPARKILSKNVNNPLFIKKDLVNISNIYSSPSQNTVDSLIDVTGSKNIDHGSSGGMVISQGQSNSLIGLSSVLIKESNPQIVRVVTLKHILSVLESDLKKINSVQIEPFLILTQDMLKKKEVDNSFIQIFKNIKLTSVLEKYTKETLFNLHIIK